MQRFECTLVPETSHPWLTYGRYPLSYYKVEDVEEDIIDTVEQSIGLMTPYEANEKGIILDEDLESFIVQYGTEAVHFTETAKLTRKQVVPKYVEREYKRTHKKFLREELAQVALNVWHYKKILNKFNYKELAKKRLHRGESTIVTKLDTYPLFIVFMNTRKIGKITDVFCVKEWVDPCICVGYFNDTTELVKLDVSSQVRRSGWEVDFILFLPSNVSYRNSNALPVIVE